ncbi:MAG: TetR/AcrR family transcriptional regulator [Chromatiales bacterium]|nr:MAG: TetR/AcrR family transcriptional regulator [Chromatiales bacterium]
MSKKGDATRQRILDAAEAMILSRGYAGTSLDGLIKSLGLTKGAFFHHFDTKSDLARHLVQRFSDEGIQLWQETKARAEKLSDDPLQQLLIIVGLYSELFENLAEPYPGCLLAAYVYEMQLFDDEVKPIINAEFLLMREEMAALIRKTAQRYPAQSQVDPVALADMFLSTFEGAFIMSKAFDEPDIIVQQLRLFKTFVETLFGQRAIAAA